MSDCVMAVCTEEAITPSHIPLTTLVPIIYLVNLSANVNVASKGTFTFCCIIKLFTSILFSGGIITKVC